MAIAHVLGGDLKHEVEAFNNSYAKGDPGWFSHFADDATVYSHHSPEPISGRDAYRQHFEKTLTGEKRTVHVIQQDAQLMGDTAVVMQLFEITTSDLNVTARESMIWHKGNDGWKVVHLNTSVVGSPTSTIASRTANAVRVVAEKIALVSSQTGVAQ
jgi:ketosteroid isomerase-like protein